MSGLEYSEVGVHNTCWIIRSLPSWFQELMNQYPIPWSVYIGSSMIPPYQAVLGKNVNHILVYPFAEPIGVFSVL